MNEPKVTREGRVIERLIQQINVPRSVTDLGARLRGSNTWHLVKHHGFKAVLVDRNLKAYKELCEFLPEADVRKELVTPENVNDFVSEDTGVLCIDVDGNDYHLWEAVRYQPAIVVIEAGQDKKVEVHTEPWIAPYDPDSRKRLDGSSELALKALGTRKGYELFEKQGVNLIFVRRSEEWSRRI